MFQKRDTYIRRDQNSDIWKREQMRLLCHQVALGVKQSANRPPSPGVCRQVRFDRLECITRDDGNCRWLWLLVGPTVSGRSKCTTSVDSRCLTLEELIAPGAGRSALRREHPQVEASTVLPSPSCPELVATAVRAGTRHPPQDGRQLRAAATTSHGYRRRG
jgi:hypothetical protein